MAITAIRVELLTAGMECHQEKADAIATALRGTYAAVERAELLLQHAEACRCVAAFRAELAKA